MELVIFIVGFLGSFLALLSGLAIFRSKDVFTITHIAMIFGIYAFPLVLLAIGLDKFSSLSSLAILIKILLLIFLNWIATHLICYFATKEALKNGVMPDVVAEIER